MTPLLLIWLVGWHHQLDGHELEQAPGVGDGQWRLACCSSWGHKESETTELLIQGPHLSSRALVTLSSKGCCLSYKALCLKSPFPTWCLPTHLLRSLRTSLSWEDDYAALSNRTTHPNFMLTAPFWCNTVVVWPFFCLSHAELSNSLSVSTRSAPGTK